MQANITHFAIDKREFHERSEQKVVFKNMDCGASTQVVCSLYQPRIVIINLHGVFCHIFVLSDIFASGLLLLFY